MLPGSSPTSPRAEGYAQQLAHGEAAAHNKNSNRSNLNNKSSNMIIINVGLFAIVITAY